MMNQSNVTNRIALTHPLGISPVTSAEVPGKLDIRATSPRDTLI